MVHNLSLIHILWAADADTYTVGFISPSGERISRIPIIANNETSIPFLLDATTITVNYQLIEAESGSQLIFMRFQTPAAGIWTVRVSVSYTHLDVYKRQVYHAIPENV